jgi:hypothetical protein
MVTFRPAIRLLRLPRGAGHSILPGLNLFGTLSINPKIGIDTKLLVDRIESAHLAGCRAALEVTT